MTIDRQIADALHTVNGCVRTFDERSRVWWCPEHQVGWLSDVDMCARVESQTQAVMAVLVSDDQARLAATRLTPLLSEDGDWLTDPEGEQFHTDVETLVRHAGVTPIQHTY